MNAVVAPDDVERFGDIVARSLGLRVADRPGSPLAAIVGRRAERYGGSARRYLDRLEADLDEVSRLAGELTVPESHFFRDADQLRAFATVALRARARARGPGGTVRILSAGCASGEEPYTLAILARTAGVAAEIVGVDINPAGLRTARAGRYSTWALRGTPPEMRLRWFRPDGPDLVLAEEIRGSVRFEPRNLSAPEPDLWRPGRYDVVFCRNVLLYFTEESRHALTARMARALAPGGYLFLGHADALDGGVPGCGLRRGPNGRFYEKPPAPVPAATDPVSRADHRIDPPAEPVPAPVEVAFGLLRAERFDAALDVMVAAPPEVRADPAVRLLTAVLYTARGDFAVADRVCRDLLAADPRSATAHYAAATCRHGMGDPGRAAFHSRAAADLDAGFAMPRLHLGLLAARSGDHVTARRELSRARALLPYEDGTRLLLFGGGFGRADLIGLCRAQLRACGGTS